MTERKTDLTCMAEIVGVHGVKGTLKLKVFSEDPDRLMDLAPLLDAKGEKQFIPLNLHAHQNIFLAEFKNINDRTQAEKLRGTKLYIPTDRLPKIKKKNTYYHADLIGLSAKYPDGRDIGTVIGVSNFGAGDLLDIKPAKGNSFYVPFTDAIVPHVDLETKTLTIDPPDGLIN